MHRVERAHLWTYLLTYTDFPTLPTDQLLPSRGDPAAAGVPRFRLLQRATICEHTAYVWELSDAPPALWIDYALLT